MKHARFFDDFLREEVNINQTRIDRLTRSVEAIEQFLSNNLAGYQSIERQGSYALGTIIKPVKQNKEYDADVLVFLDYDDMKEPKVYLEEVDKCFKSSERYKEKVRRKTRCISLEYAGDFHLDVVSCVMINGQVYICNYRTNEFEITDGTGYRNWFNEQSRITNGNLKRVTRLLKYLRDHKDNFTAPSILLTTLIGNAVNNSIDYKDLPESLKILFNGINNYLKGHPQMPEISNPALPSETLTRHWYQIKYDNFRNLFNTYNDRINDAYYSRDNDDSVEKWRKVFGEKFGKTRKEMYTSKGIVASVATTIKPRKPYAR